LAQLAGCRGGTRGQRRRPRHHGPADQQRHRRRGDRISRSSRCGSRQLIVTRMGRDPQAGLGETKRNRAAVARERETQILISLTIRKYPLAAARRR